MKTRTLHCPNCSAPLDVPLGETESLCDFCDSRLRLLPGTEEMAVVRTREEMKYRERVAVQKAILRKRLEQEEGERWRQLAGKLAITALPIVGNTAGRALFGATLRRGGGCFGWGCTGVLAALAAIVLGLLALLG